MTASQTDQGLFDLSRPHRRGRHERHVEATVRTARGDGLLGPLDEAAVSGLRGLARHLDELERAAKPEPGTFAYLHAEYRKTLIELGLTPASREAGEDVDDAGELAAVLRLGAAARGESPPGG